MITKERTTKETRIRLSLELGGEGAAKVQTGIGFFDHMLDALCRHSGVNLTLTCEGDLHVDGHHTVEDVGIVLGEAFNEAVFPVGTIERFSDRIALLDEAAVQVAMDISGRPFLFWQIPLEGRVGDFDAELAEEFFRALTSRMQISAHMILLRGSNRHHIIEAAFKAFAIALRSALAPNDRVKGVPSTKGVL